MTESIFANILQSQQARGQLGTDVVKDLLQAHKSNAVPKDSTINALLENKDVVKLVGESGIHQLLQAKEQRDRSKKRSQRSKSRGRHDHRHPENEFRNIEGEKPMENYYSKLYKNQSKKNATHLYKSKPHNSKASEVT